MIVSSLTFSLFACLVSAADNHSSANTDFDVLNYVNLFIGTTNGGHVFPGATLPHGLAKVGMDTDSPGNVRRVARLIGRLMSISPNSKRGTTQTLPTM